MKLRDLLAIEDYKEGLKALYTEYDLELGYKDQEDAKPYMKYSEYVEDAELTHKDKQEYEKDKEEYEGDRLNFIKDNNYIKTNYGWDMTELWDLDNTIFKFLLPRLYVFYKIDYSLTQDYDKDGTFKDVLEAILDALLNVLYTNEGFEETEHDELVINRGMSLLGKYIRRLWN